MCAGAIDGTHVPIKASSENHMDYVNRKSYHIALSCRLQWTQGICIGTVVGWPGSVHDTCVLLNSEVYKLGNGRALFLDIKETILGQDIYPCIVGDPAFFFYPGC